MTAILLAAGITIRAVVSTVTKALKAPGQTLAKGLKDIDAKVASILPGLVGSIVICFISEHTWLLILAAVVFVAEKYMKGVNPLP